ncbi:MAG: efflux RND transporter periplasmic adaptor subunit [Candidatus Aminicenantes bacterium]|nr:efflux RND transporter periplasmic adaptor subunit [Candidatus Aminicenantes bacterium]
MDLKKILVIAVAGLMFFLSSTALISGADEAEIKCPRTIKVETAKILGQDFKEYKVFKTEVAPGKIAVKPVVSGKVTDVKVTEGDSVSKGLELFVIDNALTAEIERLKNEVKKWQKTLRKRQGWKVRSERAEKQAERKVKENQTKLEEAEAAVPNYTITAPADGKIKSLNVSKDGEINAGETAVVIEDAGLMKAVVSVSSNEKALFSQGKEIPVLVKEINSEYKALVTQVSYSEVVLSIRNKVREIKAGHTVLFKMLKEEHKDAVVLATDRILKDDAGTFVYKVDGKYAKRTPVQVGAETGAKSLISEGLSSGDEIIVSEILTAKEGTVKEAFECVRDNVKIKLLVKDPETGRFVKAAKVGKVKKAKVKKEKVVKEKTAEPVKPKPKKVKKPKVKKERPATEVQNHITLGVGGGIFYVNQTAWSDVYPKATVMFGGKIGYQFMQKFEVFAEINSLKVTGELQPTLDEVTAKTTPFYFGARYFFKTGKIQPYAGLSTVMLSYKETTELGEFSDSAFGLSLQVGTYFNFTPNLSLDLVLKYDSLKLKNEDYNAEVNMSGARLMLFFTYKF